jgi:hypothetical protein
MLEHGLNVGPRLIQYRFVIKICPETLAWYAEYQSESSPPISEDKDEEENEDDDAEEENEDNYIEEEIDKDEEADLCALPEPSIKTQEDEYSHELFDKEWRQRTMHIRCIVKGNHK